jgi:RNA polymerase sigma-70 factor (TIGR02960 family)
MPSGVEELITEIKRRVQGLTPQRPSVFYATVTELSALVGRLRRIARTAAEAPEPAGTDAELDFAALVEQHRRELRVHCYRMVGSYDDAEDLLQETLLKAWHKRESFAGRSTVRAWMYKIATNVCLDFLRRHQREPQRYEPLPGMDHGKGPAPARITWLQPYPDEPEAAAVSRETIELVFLSAIQHLPPRQRAAFILRDVLDLPAVEAADMLDMSVAAVNSALQRARPTLRQHLPEERTRDATADERLTLQRYMYVAEHADVAAMAGMLREDVRLTMPPNPLWYVGRQAILNAVGPVFDPTSPAYAGRWKHLPTRANGQPAAAGYLQRPGTTVYRAQVLDVLRIEAGGIAEITSFEPHLFPAFGLPMTVR